jgi:tRNA (guanine-N7-)-methyltransferase
VAKKKLVHFRENLTFPHLFQPHYSDMLTGFPLRSKWNHDFFHNDHPIVLELGCGKGEYSVELAQKLPETNFIGIDIKGARLWRGAKTVNEEHLRNVAFIRQRVDFVEKFFGKDEISEIWITFPDPQRGKERKRLTSPQFLERYRNILIPGGFIHLKTDDIGLYNYTQEILTDHHHKILVSTDNLYHSPYADDMLAIQTFYEAIWREQDKKICYLKFVLS